MTATTTNAQQSIGKIVFTIALLAGLIHIYYPFIESYSLSPKWIFVGLFGLISLTLTQKNPIRWSFGLFFWGVFIIQFMIQSAASYNSWEAITHTIPWVLAPIIVIQMDRMYTSRNDLYSGIALIFGFLIAPLLIYALGGILGAYMSGDYTHQLTYDYRFAFGHRNQFIQFAVLLIPLFIVGRNYSNRSWKKFTFLLLIGLVYAAAIFLRNRTVMIVLFGVYPLCFLLNWIAKRPAKSRKLLYGGVILMVFSGGVIVTTPLRSKLPIVKQLFETSYGSGNERVRIWSNSLDLWEEQPIVGHGSGNWKMEILRTDLIHTQAHESMVFYQRAHNDFLQIAVENGAIGLVVFTLFFCFGIYGLLKAEISRSAKLALLAGILGFLVIANFSFPLERIELLSLLFLFLLPGFNKTTGGQPQRKLQTMIVTGMVSAMLVGALVLSISWINNEYKVYAYKRTGETASLDAVNKEFYTIDATSTPLIWFEANRYFDLGLYKKALPLYQKALRFNPYHVHAINNLGSCYYNTNDLKKAEDYYAKALEINPRFVESIMNYSSLKFNQKDIDGALNLILTVPIESEPTNYRMFITTIAKEKCKWLLELYDEPGFEAFLLSAVQNDELLYQVAVNCRNTWASYEDELRICHDNQLD